MLRNAAGFVTINSTVGVTALHHGVPVKVLGNAVFNVAGLTSQSPLAAFWHTEVGPLNQVIHVWPYEDLEERTSKRAEATKLDGWPPNTREFVVEQKSQIYIPAPFSPKLEPRQLGGLYEIRIYTMRPGAIPEQIERWSAQIGERTKLSPLAFAGRQGTLVFAPVAPQAAPAGRDAAHHCRRHGTRPRPAAANRPAPGNQMAQ